MKSVSFVALLLLVIITSCNSTSTNNGIPSISNSDNASLGQLAHNQEASSSISINSNKLLYITAPSGLSLRKATNLTSTKILTIPYGSQVQHLSSPEHTTMTVSGIEGDMVQVNYQGAMGFVFSGYLSTLAPPLKDESATDYAKRLSTPDKKIKVHKIKNIKGDAYGLTTSIALPAKSWGEAYLLAQKLFDIPKSIAVDLTDSHKETMVNQKKRLKTKIDQVTVGRDRNNKVKDITYSYVLTDYTRSVSITYKEGSYLITETEVSQ